jgi:hypothetical protein
MKQVLALIALSVLLTPSAHANKAKSKAYQSAKRACLEADSGLKGKALQRCIKKERAKSSR